MRGKTTQQRLCHSFTYISESFLLSVLQSLHYVFHQNSSSVCCLSVLTEMELEAQSVVRHVGRVSQRHVHCITTDYIRIPQWLQSAATTEP